MEDEPDWAADDAEIAALLDFTPVPRGVVRPDGWSPARQRGFVAWLAATGSVIAAARAVARGENGARQVRREDALGEFSTAWSRALALYRSRNGAAGERLAPPRHARELRRARAAEAPLAEGEKDAIFDEILRRYLIKLKMERVARLEGRIVEADFYVRQLTAIELMMDIGGRTFELLDALKVGKTHLVEIAATPGSLFLEKARRAVWLERGEADRPPPAPLGRHNERFATGRDEYDPECDGSRADWERAQKEKRRLAAEAQAEWEERARREAGAPSGEAASDDDPDAAP